MDPNANIDEQLMHVKRITAIFGATTDGSFTAAQMAGMTTSGARLAELVDALDDWIICGGRLPTRWKEGQHG